ncbi:MAG: UDP-N-acetyl glucosamine 2-epimerase [Candidatus Aminicenantes bacterium]|jgi:UDP-N-acetylglucosamine 2-epimerase (non-hydrolysing)
MKGKSKLKIILVAGARPNFVKIAPLLHEMKNYPEIESVLIHTGQHYDENMSERFFRELEIPEPGINLGVGSASHAVQTARIMEEFEKVCLEEKPDVVLVVGDVNSTAACTLVASKLHITTIHYEAGLRSRDQSMPEEINRLVTDAISDFFFTTSEDASENLIKEGHEREKIFMMGNLMIDSLVRNLEKAESIDMNFKIKASTHNTSLTQQRTKTIKSFCGCFTVPGGGFFKKTPLVAGGKYGVMTFHRPNNVDRKEDLEKLVDIWTELSEKIPLVFPVHPRTWKNILAFGLEKRIQSYDHLFLIEPVGYLQFIRLMKHSKFVLTDSGGIQEETTYMNIPCLIIRPTTERPVTILEGSNKLIKVDDIMAEVDLILQGKGKTGKIPKYWDGKTAERIARVLIKEFKSGKTDR